MNFNSHFDFVIGRGKVYPIGYMNIPLNPRLYNRNLIYIDPNLEMDADIKQRLHEIDFSIFGICKDQDITESIDIRFIFDWSSFYCGALHSLTNVIMGIGRKCQILVPLSKNENTIPSDIKSELSSDIFTISLVEGFYPLFDKTNNIKLLEDYINSSRYIKIYAYYDKDYE